MNMSEQSEISRGCHSFRAWVAGLFALLLAVPVVSAACGLEDPAALALGGLALSFPGAIDIETALWQARLSGKVDAMPLSLNVGQGDVGGNDSELKDAYSQDENALKGLHDLMQAGLLMDGLRSRMQTAWLLPNSERLAPVSVAVAFTPSGYWARLVPEDTSGRPLIALYSHAEGPQSSDVVLITGPEALLALNNGRLSMQELFDLGLARLYGPDQAVAEALRLLNRIPRKAIGTL